MLPVGNRVIESFELFEKILLFVCRIKLNEKVALKTQNYVVQYSYLCAVNVSIKYLIDSYAISVQIL